MATFQKPQITRRKKGGKQEAKNKHGIYGKLVSELAPSLPANTSSKQPSVAKKTTFKPPVKTKRSKQAESEVDPGDAEDDNGENVHQGLPVKGRRGQYFTFVCEFLKFL